MDRRIFHLLHGGCFQHTGYVLWFTNGNVVSDLSVGDVYIHLGGKVADFWDRVNPLSVTQ